MLNAWPRIVRCVTKGGRTIYTMRGRRGNTWTVEVMNHDTKNIR